MKKQIIALLTLSVLTLSSCAPYAVPQSEAALLAPIAEETIVPEEPVYVSEALESVVDAPYTAKKSAFNVGNISVTLETPQFDGPDGYADAYNAVVSDYEARVRSVLENEFADEAEGYAPDEPQLLDVFFEVMPAGDCVSIVFFEEYDIAGTQYSRVYTYVLDDAGNVLTLSPLSGLMEPETVAAQLVYNRIDANPADYYDDISLEDVIDVTDTHHGFTVSETGFTLYIEANVFAPIEYGPNVFEFDRADFYTVHEHITNEQYPQLLSDIREFVLAQYGEEAYVQLDDIRESAGALCAYGTLFSYEPESETSAQLYAFVAELSASPSGYTVDSVELR